ncbi:MAG TPA: hypothetical protein VFT82_03775 [Candidatus Paceibacterota bacterium]|nr:hypothetical protein [Candidatus Paceibacterota bacterium]
MNQNTSGQENGRGPIFLVFLGFACFAVVLILMTAMFEAKVHHGPVAWVGMIALNVFVALVGVSCFCRAIRTGKVPAE